MRTIPRKLLSLIAFLIIVVIAIVAVVVYLAMPQQKPTPTPVTIKPDNHISPNIGQQLDVEVTRIRSRALYDTMMTRGTAWRHPPQFYWIIDVDGKEADSLGTVGYGDNGLFTTWDSERMDTRIPFRVVDEQPTSQVTIKIMQRETTGLLGRRTVDVQAEVINLTYDYRTGRWTGDDSFTDPTGYGHYLGANYEVWFNLYQSDYDHDGIPYWTEVNVLGTDPYIDDSVLDPDHDGIPTSWEWRWGFNPFVADNFTNLDPDFDGLSVYDEYTLRNYYANPFYPEMYIEADFMAKRGPFDLPHVLFKETQGMIDELFARHNITVWIDDGWSDGPKNGGGEYLPFVKSMEDVNGGQAYAFYQHNFAQERHGLFRYVIVANKLGWAIPMKFNYYDTILIGQGWRPVIKTHLALTQRYSRVAEAKALLHELGHTLGLLPYTFPGVDIMPPTGARWPSMPADEYLAYEKDYHSVMNYNYVWKDRRLVDFSHGENGQYDENDWDHIYIPVFNRDARAVEETADENFEDYEMVNETPYPFVEGWINASANLTKSLPASMSFKVYDNIGSGIKVLVNPHVIGNATWNVRVYARPSIDPFPTTQSWTLMAEGYLDSAGKLTFYSSGQKLI